MKLVTGLVIGNWTLIELDPKLKYHWTCKCSCKSGTVASVRDWSLKNGKSTKCKWCSTQALYNRKTHGRSDSVEYKTWLWMRDRVHNRAGYENLTIHPRWEKVENFLEDVGKRPAGKHISLDRVDNKKGYGPDNWRWTNPTVQNRNRGNCVMIDSALFGIKTQTEWADILIERTGDTSWTPRKLKAALKLTSMTIDQLLKGLEITDPPADYAHDTDDRELIAA